MIHECVSPRTLGFVRAWVFGIWFVMIAADRPQRLAALPLEFFKPLGPLRLLPADAIPWLISEPGLTLFWLLLLATLFLALLGVRPYRPTAVAAVLLLTVHQCLARGFFFTNHQELPLLFVSYLLALAPAAGGFTWPRQPEERSPSGSCAASLLAMALLFTISYSLISAHRLAMNGWDLFLADSLPHWAAQNSYRETWYGMGAVSAWVLERPLLVDGLKLGFPVVTVMELLAPLSLLDRRFCWAWIGTMASFHILSLFLLDIFFWEALLLMPVLLLDIGRFTGRSPRQRALLPS